MTVTVRYGNKTVNYDPYEWGRSFLSGVTAADIHKDLQKDLNLPHNYSAWTPSVGVRGEISPKVYHCADGDRIEFWRERERNAAYEPENDPLVSVIYGNQVVLWQMDCAIGTYLEVIHKNFENYLGLPKLKECKVRVKYPKGASSYYKGREKVWHTSPEEFFSKSDPPASITFHNTKERTGMIIVNPKYAKLPRYEASALAYDKNPSEYQAATTAAVAAGGISGTVVLAALAATVFVAGYWLIAAIVAGLVAAVSVPAAIYRTNFTKKVEEIIVRTPSKNFLADTFDELCGLSSTYHKNLEAVPAALKGEVTLDEPMMRQRQWEVAKHIQTLDTFYAMGRDRRGNNGDLLNDTYTKIKGEVDTLSSAIQNLIDIGIISVTEDIKQDYMDPTIGEILAGTSLNRLQGYRELMPAKQDDTLTAAHKLLEAGPTSDEILQVHTIKKEKVGLKPKQVNLGARETKKL